MDLKELQSNWEAFGQSDPLWAILTDPDKKGNRWTEEEFFKTGLQKIRNAMRLLDELKLEVPKEKALDFGCGVGRLTRALGEHFETVNGVDIAPTMIEKARELNILGDRCSYFLNEKDDLSLFEDNSFNLVYSNITLQHIRPVYSKRYITEFLRIAKPGGIVMFQLPDKRIVPKSERMTVYVKEGVKSVLPEWVINRVKAMRQKVNGGEPYMEMNAVPRQDVEALAKEHGGTVKHIRQDSESGPTWVSLLYVIQKG